MKNDTKLLRKCDYTDENALPVCEEVAVWTFHAAGRLVGACAEHLPVWASNPNSLV